MSQTGRSFEPKWTVQEDSGRSFDPEWTIMGRRLRLEVKVIRLKVNGPDESKDKSGRYKNVKVDGPSILRVERGRFKNFKVDGLKV